MRFRLGMVTGFAAGYYMGARAGRQRYDQINRQISRLRGSETLEQATERAKAVVEEGVEKARSVVESRAGDGQGNGHNGHGYGPEDTSGVIVPPPGTTGTTTTGTTGTGATGTGATGTGGTSGETGTTGAAGEPPSGLGGYSSSR